MAGGQPGGASAPLMEVRGLSVRFGGFQALKDVSWMVMPGEMLGIIGPNGAGKSTCFNAATNVVKRDGRVFLRGREVTAEPPHRLAESGVRRTFQQNAFFNGMSVLENMLGVLQETHGSGLGVSVLLPWIAARRRLEGVIAARACLERFKVPGDLHDLLPTELPYGTQRMFSIALAYADTRPGEAQCFMLDEPAAGLGGRDMALLAEVLGTLRQEGHAVVLIEHHMDLVMELADRIVVLEQGQVLATGLPEAIQADERVLEAYLGRAAA
ncbi:ABC transporter ATP-binding protein [Bosea sp. (in: a-proteobacteria)]|uniref:ABC transporter ATP-binding protein n=1 Tax=Bosea sp. (in: a-proteobacteria) TaxID=1871050 RepID=UPI002634329A|nr:ATP-binding cassette domain-containing protein [Bosea sp. (in: a-proteobacteria)]MCO5089565.1 ATP-binding cassette domain-containing protein [Bosea sp. (in: a-proteobacteria)]